MENNNFYIDFLNTWNNDIKPFINKKFPVQMIGNFNQYSDISFLVQLVDETLKSKKIIKKKDNTLFKMRVLFFESKKEDNEQHKRTNSMIFLRPHSQTIDSKTTRTSSIQRENSGLNMQSSKKNVNIMKDSSSKNKIDKSEKENKIESSKVQSLTEGKNGQEEDIKKNEFTFDEFLNKIISGNYMKENLLLIYYFCQQCFSFLKVDILFEQLFQFYQNLKNNISDEQLSKLIEFSKVLVIEMIHYFDGDNYIDVYISCAKEFYSNLISDLMINMTNKDSEIKGGKNSITPFELDNNDENNINKEENSQDYSSNRNKYININLHEELILVTFQVEKEIELELRKSKSNTVSNKKLNKKVHFPSEGNLINEIKYDKVTRKTIQIKKSSKKAKHLSLNKDKIKEPIKEEDEKKENSDDNK